MSCNKVECDANEVISNLWLGNIKSAYDKSFHSKHKIKYIISVIDEFDETMKNNEITYIQIPIKDKHVCNKNINQLFDSVSDYIKKVLQSGSGILIHCKRGHHRSASFVAAYLIKYQNIKYENAIQYINNLRPCALRRDACITKQLYLYHLFLHNKTCTNIKCNISNKFATYQCQ